MPHSKPESAPVLSVTVTNFNYARYLPQNLDSIIGQSFGDFELIVIDNASTDGSIELLREYELVEPRLRLIVHDRNMSAKTSFRETCDISRGRYRVQIDADDWVLSTNAFELQVDQLEANPEMSFTYSPMVTVDDQGETFVYRPYDGDREMPGAEAIEKILDLSLGHSGMMLRLDTYHRVGGYPSDYQYYDDVLLAARMAELGSVGFIDQEMYAGRQHGGNENLGVDIDVVEREVLAMIDEILGGPLADRIPDVESMRRRARRRALTHQAMLHVFNGEYRVGWTSFLHSARRHPVETVIQGTTASMAARTLLGDRNWHRLRDWYGDVASR